MIANFELTVWMYHYVRDPGDAAEAGSGLPGLSLARFEAQLDRIASHYQVLDWPALRECLAGERPLPPRACLLTFDDGLADHYLNVYPALRRRGLSGLFFCLARRPGQGLALGHKLHFLLARLGYAGLRSALWERLGPDERESFLLAEAGYRAASRAGSADDEVACFKTAVQRDFELWAERVLSEEFERNLGSEQAAAARLYLSDDQIKEMGAGGMHFGGHSASHPWLDAVRPDRQSAEISASAGWLHEVEPGPWAFAYPYGGFAPELRGLLRAYGFGGAFTTVEQTHQADPYFIGRWDGEVFDSPAEIEAAALPAGTYG